MYVYFLLCKLEPNCRLPVAPQLSIVQFFRQPDFNFQSTDYSPSEKTKSPHFYL